MTMSVKNRAKMFEHLASTGSVDEQPHSGGVLSASRPSPSPMASRNGQGGSNGGGGVVSSSPFLAHSSPTASSVVSLPTSTTSTYFHPNNNKKPAHSVQRFSLGGNNGFHSSRPPSSSMDWSTEEDTIPKPSFAEKRKSFLPEDQKEEKSLPFLKPVILPTRKSLDGSPFKTLQNNDRGGESGNPVVNRFAANAQVTKKVHQMDSRSDTGGENENPIPDGSADENRDETPKESRNARFSKAKQRGTSPSPAIGQGLKQSLNAAAIVMEEVKSSAGSSSGASSHSSLSHQELSQIASRAMVLTKGLEGEKASGGSLRGSRTITKVSHQEARRALLNATMKKKTAQSSTGQDVAERLGLKANRAVALKNASKPKTAEATDHGIAPSSSESTRSHDSGKSRRSAHPAIAGRKTNVAKFSGADLLASFRQFNAARKESENGSNTTIGVPKPTSGRPPVLDSLYGRNTSKPAPRPKKQVEPPSGDESDVQSLDSAEGSTDDHFFDQEESMHSMVEKHYLDNFYQMGRVDITMKNCHDAYLSSLSSNTFSIQSITSQSVGTLKSPASQNQNVYVGGSKLLNTLDPTPEYSSSTQTMKSEILVALSPGPSSRSAHSFANSINSASPKSRAPTPKSDNDGKSENESSDKNSSNSADVLEAVLDAAVEDIVSQNVPSISEGTMEVVSGDRLDRSHPSSKITDGSQEASNVLETLQMEARSVAILPASSGRSHSPPGFIFNDSDESENIVLPPDPGVGQGKFVHAKNLFGDNVDDDTFGQEDGQADDNNSFSAELRGDVLKADSFVDSDAIKQLKEGSAHKQGSSSTKKTVSTSIRTGMSSIQNEQVEVDAIPHKPTDGIVEGSSSIRTGLSGLQSPRRSSNDMERSASLRLTVAKAAGGQLEEEKKATIFPVTNIPATIAEDRSKASTPEISKVKSGKDESVFFGLKAATTSTTDGSSGIRIGCRGTLSDPMSSASDTANGTGIETGFQSGLTTQAEDTEDEPLSTLPPTLQTNDDDVDEYSGDENETSYGPSPVSKNSRPWKGIFGKRVGDAIKNVLAKASPRSSASLVTPRGTKRQESRSLFSSVDDDEDIFGGLEDDEGDENRQQEAERVPPEIAMTPQKNDAKTPRQRNSKNVGKVKSAALTPSNRASDIAVANKDQDQGEKGTLRAKDVPATALTRKEEKKKHRRSQSSPATDGSPSLYSHDRSGTVVDESEVLHVNSDITSSLIGGPISSPGFAPNAAKKDTLSAIVDLEENIEPKEAKQKSPTSRSKSTRKSKSTKSSSLKAEKVLSRSDKLTSVVSTSGKSRRESMPFEAEEVSDQVDANSDDQEEKKAGSMFMKMGCGLAEHCSTGFASICTPANKEEETLEVEEVHSSSSHPRLTDIEKKVWSEWDRLNDKVMGANHEMEKMKEKPSDKKEEHEKKREAARDKLLDIASTAMSSHISGKSIKDGHVDGEPATTAERAVSASASSESGITKDSGSGVSGASGHTTCTGSGESRSALSSQESSHGYSTEYSSALESDFVSEVPSSGPSQGGKPSGELHTAEAPILLSFSQRSLMEKFTKQLTSVGVEVLKLNRRKQWQVRHFTVSREQIALSAHEAISKTGDMARCPKALLWLKKFNPKSGGYGITNIDKNGHGGMLLVDLAAIQVSNAAEDMLENPLPKKLSEKFKESALITLQYKMKGNLRSVEFRCKDNDEAQFLCTCMRVIRDLLRRERSLRSKANKHATAKKARVGLATLPNQK